MPVLDLERPLANNGQAVTRPPRVHYPTSDNVGESGLQFFVCNLLLIPLLRSYFSEHEQQVRSAIAAALAGKEPTPTP